MTSACIATYGSLENRGCASAVSDVAIHLQESIRRLFRAADDVQTFSARENLFESMLRGALDDLVVDDDQYAVSTAAVQRASQLIQSLPSEIPVPDVAVDPDGEVSLDWVPSRTRAFSISVGDSDRLAFAWMDGTDRAHGVFRFTSSMPRSLLLQLAELTTEANAAVRAA